MSSTPEFNTEQLAAVRAQRWHQGGDALLTQEAAREWLSELGLVLFAPRPQQMAAPAPSLVEATLGRAAESPTLAEMETARGLLARMVADGSALPLNLLGGPGDLPDFVVSAQVFSYVFTLRGDKAWKQPPSTSGAVKVSPLALKVYEVLAERGALTAGELVSDLGRELTENAIARSLSELWMQLRVIPLLQQDGAATMWELVSRRFTKPMKAGANAGQPTALSALISLYLAQAYAATEDEIETFLSPLAARSRVRDVLHGLTAGRQLEPVVLEGKTLLHIPGTLPEFPVAAAVAGEVEGVEAAAVETPKKKVGTGRIRSFAGEREARGALRGKPAREFGGGRNRASGARPARPSGASTQGRTDRERRPFKRAEGGKPSFTKPWDEDRKPRREGAASAGGAEAFQKFRKPEAEDRKPLGDREQAGLPPEDRVFSKPKYERESRARDEARRTSRPREAGADRSFAKRPYTARTAEGGAKPRFERGGKPGGFGAKRPYKPREAEGGEQSFAKRPYKPRAAEGGEKPFAKRPYTPRGTEGGGERPFAKRPYKPREIEGGERPFAKRPYTPRATEGGGRPFVKRPYKPRETEGGERPFAKRPYTPRATEGGERPFAKRTFAPRAGGDRERPSAAKRPFAPRGEGRGGERAGGPARKPFGAKPGGKFGGRPGAKFSGGKPAGKFGPKKFGAKPGGFGSKKGGSAGASRPAPRKPEAEE